MIPPKAIIFDLDGTLIHSAPDLHAAANVALASEGRDPLDLDTVISFIGNGVDALIAKSLDVTGGSDAALHVRALATFMAFYTQNMTTLTKAYPGVIAALNDFRDTGIPLGICTNKPVQPARDICDQMGLTAYFADITGAQDGQARKPDPAPLLASIDNLGVDPAQALYVGDSAVDYHTARNAHVSFRLFSKGYLNDPLPDLSESDSFDDWAAHGIPLPE
ncbi:Phosphoglycolate phosphatase, bacterial [Sulfitobacter noctilucicola]|uniref:phosphoglycolate phosphatase n=1 Tax=Sulfitobacter noctilucicola TaxID=1342301 RepID=A0A7W6MAB8_9RHOB|nr:phosphoglycolate phosphatase [Sulfitobacter noctilucicola]KIN63946.1 Phosphoglycolate phosphatase, bacterial [Sulfitobacter noctilucicola]MBB4175304.1 phosphoglycolate phosphatase [Sulfitobacter noctilucicola]